MADLGNQYQPDWVTSPGEILQELLVEREMTVVDLSERMGRSLECVRGILTGRLPVSDEVAVCLENALGAPAAFWSKLERQYRRAENRSPLEDQRTANDKRLVGSGAVR